MVNKQHAHFVGVWHARKPGMDVVLVLYRGGKWNGWLISYSVRHGTPRRTDSQNVNVPGGTEAQAIAATDEMFAELCSGTTRLGAGWLEPSRTMVNGDRAALVATLKALDLTDLNLN